MKMPGIFIFGGTSEGRELAEFCAANGISAYVSVTTEYGAELLPRAENLHILIGKADCGKMCDMLSESRVSAVIDATHPYAVSASANITAACDTLKIKRYRVVRDKDNICTEGSYFDNAAQIAAYLNTVRGNVLITTGSKELAAFTAVESYRERCAVRVLCMEKIVNECIDLGFARERIIAEKGPFSEKQNAEHLRRYGAEFLVTKDSGDAGGFAQKVSAASSCGARLLIIRRPYDNGISIEKMKEILLGEYAYE